MDLNPEWEAEFKAKVADLNNATMADLRMTLQKGYNPKDGGYGETVEEARFNLISQNQKSLNRMSSEHLRRYK